MSMPKCLKPVNVLCYLAEGGLEIVDGVKMANPLT